MSYRSPPYSSSPPQPHYGINTHASTSSSSLRLVHPPPAHPHPPAPPSTATSVLSNTSRARSKSVANPNAPPAPGSFRGDLAAGPGHGHSSSSNDNGVGMPAFPYANGTAYAPYLPPGGGGFRRPPDDYVPGQNHPSPRTVDLSSPVFPGQNAQHNPNPFSGHVPSGSSSTSPFRIGAAGHGNNPSAGSSSGYSSRWHEDDDAQHPTIDLGSSRTSLEVEEGEGDTSTPRASGIGAGGWGAGSVPMPGGKGFTIGSGEVGDESSVRQRVTANVRDRGRAVQDAHGQRSTSSSSGGKDRAVDEHRSNDYRHARDGSRESEKQGSSSGGGGGGPGNERVILSELGHSKDDGDTLDLSRKGIDKIDAGDVAMLRGAVGKGKKGVWRLALSYNRLLNDSFDRSFNTLARLRYLNLKGNRLTELPSVLMEMPSLEILDVSKNDIAALPIEPGRLTQLRVLSLTKNRITRLPGYLVYFANLRVLKVDENPIEWPPQEILDLRPIDTDGPAGPSERPAISRSVSASVATSTATGGAKKDDDMKIWIATIKAWMRSQEQDQVRKRSQEQDQVRLLAESLRGFSSGEQTLPPSPSQSPIPTGPAPVLPDASILSRDLPALPPPSPKHPEESASGPSSLTSSRPLSPPPTLRDPSPESTKHEQGHQHKSTASGSSQSGLLSQSVTRSASEDSTSMPPLSAASTDSSQASYPPTVANLARESSNSSSHTMKGATHTRGSSYNASQRNSANLASKKSLPDLRQSHARIILDRRDSREDVVEDKPTPTYGLAIGLPGISPASPSTPGKSKRRSLNPKPPVPEIGLEEPKNRLARKASDDILRRMGKSSERPGRALGGGNAIQEGSDPNAQMDESRNSYFRRLSTLPVSTISKAIPPALLRFIDAIRGILFALSQIHSALKQYLAFAVDERIANIFSRVMGPASEYMNTLINALDRFDSMSRKRTPPPMAIKQVLEACRDNVAVFAKVVAVLQLQVKALAGMDDVRYTRTLLLMMYGSLAEIAGAWQAMAPLVEDIRPLIGVESTLSARSIPMHRKGSSSLGVVGGTPISPIPERAESHSPEARAKAKAQTPPSLAATGMELLTGSPEAAPFRVVANAREKSRRNAGSFSSEDVQMGMMLGPADATGPATDSAIMIAPGRSINNISREVKLPGDSVAEVAESEEQEERIRDSVTLSPSKSSIRRAASEDMLSGSPKSAGPKASAAGSITGLPRHTPSSSIGSFNPPRLAPGAREQAAADTPPQSSTIPSSAATIVDEGVLDTLEQASEIAYSVWLKISEELSETPMPVANGGFGLSVPAQSLPEVSPKTNQAAQRTRRIADLLTIIGTAEETTRRLRESLMEVRASGADHTQLPSSSWSSSTSNVPAVARLPVDAQDFIRIVVKVSEQVIALQNSKEHVFPTKVKNLLAKLTNKTRECGILMQVSTFRPPPSASGVDSFSFASSASRPYSPAFSYSHGVGSSADLPDSALLGSAGRQGSFSALSSVRHGMSRSRSANVMQGAGGEGRRGAMLGSNGDDWTRSGLGKEG